MASDESLAQLSEGSTIRHAVAGQLRIDIPLELVFLRNKLFQLFFAVELKYFWFFLTADFLVLLDGDFRVFDRLDGEFFAGVQAAEDFSILCEWSIIKLLASTMEFSGN
jgi:hypothetical protein